MHTCLILPKIFPFLTKKVVKGTWVDILFITLCFQIVPKQFSSSLASISLPFTIHGTSWHHSRTVVLNHGAPFIVVSSTSLHLGSTGGMSWGTFCSTRRNHICLCWSLGCTISPCCHLIISSSSWRRKEWEKSHCNLTGEALGCFFLVLT